MFKVLKFVALAALFVSAPSHAANLVINGSFEDNPLGGRGWSVYDSIPGWETVDGAGIEIQSDGLVVPAQDGSYYVEMDSHNFGPGPRNQGSNTTFGQTLELTEGAYELSFWYRPRTNRGGDDNGLEASIAGESLLVSSRRRDENGNEWVEYTLGFEVEEKGKYDLLFGGYGRENTLGGLLDNVSVSAVPEPATWMMMIIGFGMIASTAKRRRRSLVSG